MELNKTIRVLQSFLSEYPFIIDWYNKYLLYDVKR